MSRPLTPDEVERLRRDTPGVENRIHCNHAGASLPPNPVLETHIAHLRREAEIGGYEAADEAVDRDRAVYESIGRLIGATPEEIARAEHATAAWNAGFWAVPMRAGQRILTAEAEYGANAVAFLRARERRGMVIDVVPCDRSGQLDIAELERRLDDDVALVAITHVPTNGGLVNPVAEIGALTSAAGVPYLVDACQSIGQLAIEVDDIGCDLLSATGRKYLRGPRGTGFLYARSTVVNRLKPDHPDHHGAAWDDPDGYRLHPGARRFEYWEYSHAGWLALGRAVDYATAIGLDRIEATVDLRAERLRGLLDDKGFAVFDLGARRCGIVTTAIPGRDPVAVRDALRARSINTSVTEPDGTRWDFTRRGLPAMLRISVHYLTTDDELDAVVAALEDQR
ncbi:MAG: aminotransferase class V-fold PLP-dependent enzyme [Acidimicrobiia bacterium]|nr:aminotransferase class V-fold PLP-dependent enzyme [Acidimicrobiia bacterium]